MANEGKGRLSATKVEV